jgi:2-oxo-4-hydroxy-4-carboxy-5-ureidoimidazoline decarboxylase
VTLAELNGLPAEEAWRVLERCCGADVWVDSVCASRPHGSADALNAASEAAFAKLRRGDWLEAFTHHPKIGDVAGLREKFAATAAWAGDEQRGAAGADEATLQALADGNAAYEERFGHIFIVCATGKSAAEMLALLSERLPNDPAEELRIAAEEQKKITALRLKKLIDG